MSQVKAKRVALVYDRVNSQGGAEKVLQSLHKIYPNAPLYTAVWDQEGAPWSRNYDIRTSFLQHWPLAKKHHQLFGWLTPFIFEGFDFSGYDLVISVTSEAAKGVVTKPEQLHVCYLLTPTRYLWSHEQEYREEFPTWLQSSAKSLQKLLQKWDWVAARRPDFLIPISQLVQKRAQDFYGLKTEQPIYPPLQKLPTAQQPKFVPDTKFFMSWGRHVRYKAFDLIIKACIIQKQTLLLLGEGPDTDRLQQIARELDPHDKYVFFTGRAQDSELAWYLQHAQAAIFPHIEDFGLTILEAVSQGCPVIIHKDSGAAELLKDGRDGVFLNDTTQISIEDAMDKIQSKSWSLLDRDAWSREYAEVAFTQHWQKKISGLWEAHKRQLKGNL